jgi:autotransporter translocation and assembly factor TamB
MLVNLYSVLAEGETRFVLAKNMRDAIDAWRNTWVDEQTNGQATAGGADDIEPDQVALVENAEELIVPASMRDFFREDTIVGMTVKEAVEAGVIPEQSKVSVAAAANKEAAERRRNAAIDAGFVVGARVKYNGKPTGYDFAIVATTEGKGMIHDVVNECGTRVPVKFFDDLMPLPVSMPLSCLELL